MIVLNDRRQRYAKGVPGAERGAIIRQEGTPQAPGGAEGGEERKRTWLLRKTGNLGLGSGKEEKVRRKGGCRVALEFRDWQTCRSQLLVQHVSCRTGVMSFVWVNCLWVNES